METELESESGGGSMAKKKMLWGGRFSTGLDPIMEKFNASISFDKRMCLVDIRGSIAYAKCIQKADLLTRKLCARHCRAGCPRESRSEMCQNSRAVVRT